MLPGNWAQPFCLLKALFISRYLRVEAENVTKSVGPNKQESISIHLEERRRTLLLHDRYRHILLWVLLKAKELIQEKKVLIYFADLGPLCGYMTALLMTPCQFCRCVFAKREKIPPAQDVLPSLEWQTPQKHMKSPVLPKH